MRRISRLLAAALAAPLALAGGGAAVSSSGMVFSDGVSFASGGLADELSAQVDRLAGADRYGTSAEIAGQYSPGVPAVYIATGASFPDALAAGAAAGQNSPVLLVSGGTVPAVVRAEVTRLQPGQIILVGGAKAVPDSVGATLATAAGASWSRLSGADRYATAAAVSSSTFSPGVAKAYLVSGRAFPDALTASALGARDGSPVLLTDPATLPQPTIDELTRLAPSSIVVLGGTASVSDAVLEDARAYAPTVTRVQGPDRYATNAAADAAVPGPVDTLVVASAATSPTRCRGRRSPATSTPRWCLWARRCRRRSRTSWRGSRPRTSTFSAASTRCRQPRSTTCSPPPACPSSSSPSRPPRRARATSCSATRTAR